MSWIFTEQDFHGEAYSEYHRYGFFGERGTIFNQRWNALKGQAILIAGCGYGYLVEELIGKGFSNVWGMDASQFAVNNAPPGYENRILLGNITVDQDVRNAANTAGIRGGNARFSGVITEDVLPCMDNVAEVQSALNVLRGRTTTMAHIITPKIEDTTQHPDMLWLTQQEWINLIGPGEPIVFTNSAEVVNT